MKVKFVLTMKSGDITGTCSFDADVNWMANDMRHADKMPDFKGVQLLDLIMSYPNGSTCYYVPPKPPPPGALEWLRDFLGFEIK